MDRSKINLDYKKLVTQENLTSADNLCNFFCNHITDLWIKDYATAFPKHGEIFQQKFEGYYFLVDFVWDYMEQADTNNELPGSRVIAFFGISNTNVKASNRARMRQEGKTSELYASLIGKYDKGHYIAHSMGAPVDMNIFPQRRDINRGWSAEGKRYRAMERYVAANPGTFVFSRPIYNDLLTCPNEIEYGYFDMEGTLHLETFPNRYCV